MSETKKTRPELHEAYGALLVAEAIAAGDPKLVELATNPDEFEPVTVKVHGRAVKLTRKVLDEASRIAVERKARGYAGEPDEKPRAAKATEKPPAGTGVKK